MLLYLWLIMINAGQRFVSEESLLIVRRRVAKTLASQTQDSETLLAQFETLDLRSSGFRRIIPQAHVLILVGCYLD